MFTSKLILIKRMGERKRDCRVPLNARPNSMHNLPHVETLWMLSRVFQSCAERSYEYFLMTRVKENKVDQGDRSPIVVIDHDSGPFLIGHR